MTNQEVFDKCLSHLRKQGKKSVDPHNQWQCMYRGGMGRMCAIGALIPDELYQTCFENKTIYSLLGNHPEIKEHFDGVNPDVLVHLQDVHDSANNYDFLNSMEQGMHEVAYKFGLQYTPQA